MRKLLTLLSFLLVCAPCFACDCEGSEKSLQESVQQAHTIFLGKMVSIKEYKPTVKPQSQWDKFYLVEFEVKEAFKGVTTKTIKLIEEGSSCGLNIIKGQIYLVFTYFDEQEKMSAYHQYFKSALQEKCASDELAFLRANKK